MSASQEYNFDTLKVTTPHEYVKHVELNRPQKRNAMNTAFWREMVECFKLLSQDPDCRVIILSGSGPLFTAGLDLQDSFFGKIPDEYNNDPVRKATVIRKNLVDMQESFNVLEKCPKPVIAAIHGACIGGGVDMISACDIRYCTQDAWFSIKEVDIGLAADLGTLQRFPKIVGNDSLVRELIYTARKFFSDEAKSIGLISRIFHAKEEMMLAAFDLGKCIASKSPVAIHGSKANLVYSRDHSVSEALQYQVTYNSLALQSEDVGKAAIAYMQKETPVYAKL